MPFIKDIWTPLPPLVKGGVVLGAGFLGYKGGKALWKKLNPSAEEQTVTTAKTETEQILKNNLKVPPGERILPTFSKSQYKQFADDLYTEMDAYYASSADKTMVYNIFKQMQNDLDILYLVDAFGTRTGSHWFSSNTPRNLNAWLQGDGLTNNINAILETKAGITKRM